MARNIGSIEVSVDLDTGKITAQMKAEGKKAGKAAAVEIDKALSDLEGEIKKINYKKEAELARKGIEAKLRGITADVAVELDLAQARAVLKEFEEQTEAMRLILDPSIELSDEDLAAIEKDFRAVKGIIENQKIDIQIQAMLDEAQIEFEKAQAERQLNDMEARAEIEIILREGEEARVQAELDRLDANIEAELDTTQAAVELARWRMEQGANAVEVDLDLKLAEATAAFDAWRMSMSAKGIDTDVDPDTIRATIRFQQWIEAMEKEDIDVEVNVDDSGFTRAERGLSARTKLIAGAILTLGEPLTSGLAGLVASATSVISSAVLAMGSSVAAAIPIVAGFGAAFTAGIVGAQGFADEMKAVNKEFDAAIIEGREFSKTNIQATDSFQMLAPAAQDAAMAFADVRDELRTLRQEVQGQLFAGFADAIRSMGQETIPDMSDALEIAAGSLNEFGRGLADIANNTDFAGTMEALDPALDDAFDAAQALVRTLEPFLKSAAPAAERLAEMIERGAEGLESWFAQSKNQDKFASFLDDGLDSLEDWVELLGSTGDLLATIFSAGKASGDSFVNSINDMIERWDHFLGSTEEGKEALASFFESGRDAIASLEPVFSALGEAIQTLVTGDAARHFDDLAKAVGELIIFAAELLAVLGATGLTTSLINLVTSFQPLLDLLGMIPEPLLQVVGLIGAFGIAAATVGPKVVSMASAVIKMAESLITMQTAALTTNVALAAITVVITGALMAWQAYSGRNKEAEARSKELASAIDEVADAMIRQKGAAEDTGLATKILNETFATTGDDGEKLTKVLGRLGQDTGDTLDIFMAMGQDAPKVLADLAQGYGMTADEAERMAFIVDQGDDAQRIASAAMAEFMNTSELTDEQIIQLARDLEELQDQQKKTNWQETIRGQLELAAGAEETSGIMKQLGIDTKSLATMTETELIAAYQKLQQTLAENAEASQDGTSANDKYRSSVDQVKLSIDNALAVHAEQTEALKKEQKAAYDAFVAQQHLATATKKAVIAAAGGLGVSDDLAGELVKLGEAADDASEASSALSDSLDILFGRDLTASQVFDDFNRFLRETSEEMAKVGETGESELPKVGSALEAAFGQTEAAQNFRDVMREGVDQMFEFATAATEAGTPAAEIAGQFGVMRDQLVALGEQFGLSNEESQAFIDGLLGAPGVVETVISTPGLLDALINAEDLTLLYDEAGQPVIPEFINQGIDVAMAEVTGFKEYVEGLNTTVAAPTIETPTVPVAQGKIGDLATAFDELGGKVVTPGVTADIAEVQTKVGDLNTAFDELDGKEAKPTVTVITANTETKIGDLATAFDELGQEVARPQVIVSTIQPVQTKLGDLATAFDELDGARYTPAIHAPTIRPLRTEIDTLDQELSAIDRVNSRPRVTAPTIAPLQTKVGDLATAFDELDAMSPDVRITNNAQVNINQIDALDQTVDNLTTSKTITIRTVMIGSPRNQSMTGRLVTGPMVTSVGERGYSEAIVPLELPLNRVNPEVRHFAELLRGEGGSSPGQVNPATGKIVNNYMTITPQSADPGAVATQIINRAAVLANR